MAHRRARRLAGAVGRAEAAPRTAADLSVRAPALLDRAARRKDRAGSRTPGTPGTPGTPDSHCAASGRARRSGRPAAGRTALRQLSPAEPPRAVRAAALGDGAAAGGGPGRGPPRRAGGPARQLFRPWRRLPPGFDPGGPPGAGLRRRADVAHRLRGADRRGAGRGDHGAPGRRRSADPPGAAHRRGAALLRPAAALVPRPARAGERGLQRPSRRAAGRCSGPGRLRRRPRRPRGASRGAAHDVPGRGGRAGAEDRPEVDQRWPPGAAAGRPRGAAGARGGGPPAVRGGSAAPVRRGVRAAPAHHAAAAGSGRPHRAVLQAPHHLRRVVERRAGPRAGGPLCGRPRGASLAPAAPACAVRRLRGLAAAVDGRRSPGASARLLAAAAGRRAGRPGAAGGPSAAGGRHRPGRPAHGAYPGRARRGSRGARPAPGAHPVHDPARRLGRPALPADRPDGPGRRNTDRQPYPGGDPGADRLLHQHPGSAHAAVARRGIPGAGPGGARGGAGGVRPPGPAVRAAGRGARSAAEPGAHPPVPGDVRIAEPALRGACHAGPLADSPGAGAGDQQVRPQPVPGRGGRRPVRDPRIRLRPLRRDDRGEDPGALPGFTGGGGGRSGAEPGRSVPAAAGRAASDPRRMERRPRLGRLPVCPPPGRGAGAADAGRHRRSGGGRDGALLPGARPAGRPAGAPVAGAGCAAGRPRRRLPGAELGGGGGAARRAQGRGLLPAARSGLSRGATGLHACRRRGAGDRYARVPRWSVAGWGERRRSSRGRPRPPVLRHLHLRLDRPAQRGRPAAPHAGEPDRLADRRLGRAGRPDPAVRLAELRRVGPGGLRHLGRGGHAGPGARRGAQRRRGPAAPAARGPRRAPVPAVRGAPAARRGCRRR